MSHKHWEISKWHKMAKTEKLRHGNRNVLFRNVELSSRTTVFLWEAVISDDRWSRAFCLL